MHHLSNIVAISKLHQLVHNKINGKVNEFPVFLDKSVVNDKQKSSPRKGLKESANVEESFHKYLSTSRC